MEFVPEMFPEARKPKRGYQSEQVDEFFRRARAAYDADPGSESSIASVDIRRVAFSMQKGGYSPAHVDAALERLEDAFAHRERAQGIDQYGPGRWRERNQETIDVVVRRMSRPIGRRFSRASFLTTGYHRGDVDRFANRILRHFLEGAPLTSHDVRSTVFRPQWHGYKESQVDRVLDAVIEVILAAR